MKKILKTISLAALIAPVIHLIAVFSVEERITFSIALNVIPAILVFITVIVVISYTFSNIKNKLAQQPFGNLSMLFFAGTAIIVVGAMWMWFNSILASAQESYDVFVQNWEFYIQTLWWLMMYYLIAIAVSGYAFWKYKE